MAADVPRRDGFFYKEITVPATFGAGDDVGFVADHWKLLLASGGPVEYSFDAGETVAGILGPSGTRDMAIEHDSCASRIWFKGAGSVKVEVWASIS